MNPARAIAAAATIADALVAAAWVALLVDSARLAWRDHDERARSARARPHPIARLAVLVVLVAGTALLERRAGGRLGFHPVAAVAGAALAWGGVALHARARRVLGGRWATDVTAPADHRMVTRGPYAVVRHPLYLGVLLLAAGTVLVHPSAATLCIAAGLAAGIALKIPAEERALRTACGEQWTRYASAVPALVPRLSRASR